MWVPDIRCDNIGDANLIARASDWHYNPVTDRCIARVDKDGTCRGGCIFTHYTGPGGSITGHLAQLKPRSVTRSYLWFVFHYAFDVLKARKIIGTIQSSNVDALHFDLHLGFKAETLIREVFPNGDDMLVVSMYREDCRFLNRVPRELVKG